MPGSGPGSGSSTSGERVESALARIAEACLEAPLHSTPWLGVARALAREFGEMSVIVSLAPGWSPMGPSFSEGISEAGMRSVMEGGHRANPWARHSQFYPEGYFGLGFDHFSPSDLRRTAFYNEWIRPEGLNEEQIYGGFPVLRDGVDELLVVVAGRSRRPAPPALLELGARAMPLLKRTFRILERLGDSAVGRSADAQRPAWSRQVLDRLRIAAWVVDASGRIAYLNRSADETLRSEQWLCASRGRIRSADPLATPRLHELIAQSASGLAARGGALSLLAPGHSDAGAEQDAQLLVTPLPGAGARGLALLLLVPGPLQSEGPVELLRRSWGLTPAEARLTVQLASSFSLRDAAEQQGLAYETARTYFKRAAEKLGVRSQAEAIDRVRRLGLIEQD